MYQISYQVSRSKIRHCGVWGDIKLISEWLGGVLRVLIKCIYHSCGTYAVCSSSQWAYKVSVSNVPVNPMNLCFPFLPLFSSTKEIIFRRYIKVKKPSRTTAKQY